MLDRAAPTRRPRVDASQLKRGVVRDVIEVRGALAARLVGSRDRSDAVDDLSPYNVGMMGRVDELDLQ